MVESGGGDREGGGWFFRLFWALGLSAAVDLIAVLSCSAPTEYTQRTAEPSSSPSMFQVFISLGSPSS